MTSADTKVINYCTFFKDQVSFSLHSMSEWAHFYCNKAKLLYWRATLLSHETHLTEPAVDHGTLKAFIPHTKKIIRKHNMTLSDSIMSAPSQHVITDELERNSIRLHPVPAASWGPISLLQSTADQCRGISIYICCERLIYTPTDTEGDLGWHVKPANAKFLQIFYCPSSPANKN